MMRKLSSSITLGVLVLSCLFFVTTALAGRSFKGNGFPCGEHYNLNIISKKDGFSCPDESNTDQNVIYIPVDNDPKVEPIQIYMDSGKKKDMGNYTEFIVTDWCAGFGDSNAYLKLPAANREGYAVYARAVGKLGDGLNIEIFDPTLNFIKDENQDNLLPLGLITQDGVTPYFSPEPAQIDRKKGGKNNKAVPITDLFLWTGNVCYFSDTEITGYQCCIDNDSDGAYDDCVDPDLAGNCPTTDHDRVSVNCTLYENEWVFNIADFVSAFWKVDNNGVKVLQIRFYPLPLCNE
jgi:hypothetical protein